MDSLKILFMFNCIAPARGLAEYKDIIRQHRLHFSIHFPAQMLFRKELYLRQLKLYLWHIAYNCDMGEKHRIADLFALCLGRLLIFFLFSLYMIFPLPNVNSSGTAVSSKFINNGIFPSATARLHNHWDQLHVSCACDDGEVPLIKKLQTGMAFVPPTKQPLNHVERP